MSEDGKQIAELGKKLTTLAGALNTRDQELTEAQTRAKKSLQNEDQKLTAKLRKQVAELESEIKIFDKKLTELQMGVEKSLQNLRADLQVQNGKMQKKLRELKAQIAESFSGS